jgi:DNA-binding response OmpR family regulator
MRLLVIEDEPRIRGFLTRGMEAEGFAVDGAATGDEGLERARDGPYDAVLLDLLLPGTDGLTVLRELHHCQPSLPVVIVSARADLRTKLQGFALGASDYVAKPFSFDELLARIRVQVRRRLGGDDTVRRAGRLTLDLAAHQARLGDRVADLSAREFGLLLHLVEHADEVVSRERLLSDVWGYHFDPRSNVVEVYVRRLRQKLGPDTPIDTVRHAGYRLRTS